MFKAILVNKGNSKKIPLNATGKNTKENLGCTKEDWENLFSVFEDINGTKYVMCHGTKDGFLVYKGFAVTGYDIYDSCINRGFIHEGEPVIIVCCYGKTVATETAKCTYYIKDRKYNFSFFNTDALPMTCCKTILNNGLVRVNLYTSKNVIERKINELKSSF